MHLSSYKYTVTQFTKPLAKFVGSILIINYRICKRDQKYMGKFF